MEDCVEMFIQKLQGTFVTRSSVTTCIYLECESYLISATAGYFLLSHESFLVKK
jgi:hypothetical protein